MRFQLDESADFRLGRYLGAQGHDVMAIARDHPQALRDNEVLQFAFIEQRILITRDRDSGELIFRNYQPHHCVIPFRLGTAQISESERWMDYIIERHQASMHHFLVVTEGGLRIRQVTRH